MTDKTIAEQWLDVYANPKFNVAWCYKHAKREAIAIFGERPIRGNLDPSEFLCFEDGSVLVVNNPKAQVYQTTMSPLYGYEDDPEGAYEVLTEYYGEPLWQSPSEYVK